MKTFKINGNKAADRCLSGIRLTSKQHNALKKLAEENKITMQEVVRQMIDHCLSEEEVKK